MKKLLLLSFFLFLFKISIGQVLISLLFGDKLNEGNLEFGLNLSYNSSAISNVENPSRLGRMGFGLYMTQNLNEKIGIDYAFFFSSPKGSKGLTEEDLFWDIPDAILDGQLERRLEYFELPIEFFYKINTKLAISAGGYLAYLHGTKDRITTDINLGQNVFERSITGEMNPFDAGVGIHLKYHFLGNPGTQISFGYQRGLIDIYKSSDLTGFNDVIDISVLIPIKIGVL